MLYLQDTLDPKMRQNLEKRLTALVEESQENRKKYLEKKYAVRYHKVRFFERIKVERTIKKIKKDLKASPDESLKEALAEAEEDLEYILNFPKGEKYVSLLKDSEDPEAQEHLESERKRLRLLVKQQMRDEAIVNELNEGIQSTEQSDAKHAKDIKAVPVERDDGSDSDENIEDDDFFMQSSEESDPDIPVPSDDDREQPKTCLDVSLRDDGTASSVENIEATEPESDDIGTAQTISETKPDDKDYRSRKNDREARLRDDSKKKVHPKSRMPVKKSSGTLLKGKKQPLGKKKDTNQPLRSRAEGGRKRRKKK